MRHNEKIAGYEGLSRMGTKLNWHITDNNGHAQFCGCMRGIWTVRVINGKMKRCPAAMRDLRDSRRHHLDQWHREWTFERNLEKIRERNK
jgi:hypothetical protein